MTTSAAVEVQQIPSYHTYGANDTVAGAGRCLVSAAGNLSLAFSNGDARRAILTNLEATAITYHLKEWRADVLTLWHVLPAGRPTDDIELESRK